LGEAVVHELSIAQSLIEVACDTAQREGARRVTKLFTRIGALSGVVKEALQFSFAIAAEGTACEGAVLNVEDVQVTVMCPLCDGPRTLQGAYDFGCPVCGAPTPDILTGRELVLVSLEVDFDDASDC